MSPRALYPRHWRSRLSGIALTLMMGVIAADILFPSAWAQQATAVIGDRLSLQNGAEQNAMAEEEAAADAEIDQDLHRNDARHFACERLPVGRAHDLCIRQEQFSVASVRSASMRRDAPAN